MTPVFALSTVATALLGVALVVVFFVFYGISTFNTLVALRNRYKNAFSQIDVQLKRRYDLIPNLVETAKGYMSHERETLEAVIHARNQAVTAQQKAATSPGDPSAMTGLGAAEGQLTGALGRLFALAESYPDLKANTTMLALQEELTSTENKVAFSRQSFNDAVMTYNTQVERFPASLIAGIGGFARAAFRAGIAQGTRGAARFVLTGAHRRRLTEIVEGTDQGKLQETGRRWTFFRIRRSRGRRPAG